MLGQQNHATGGANGSIIEEYGGAGSLTYFPNMIRKELTSRKIADVSEATPKELKEAKRIGRDKFLATLMLNGANASKYNEPKRSMAENYVTGTNKYPVRPLLEHDVIRSQSLKNLGSAHSSSEQTLNACGLEEH
jgi:hypothetical protein